MQFCDVQLSGVGTAYPPYTEAMYADISFAEIWPLESASTPSKAFLSPASLLSMLLEKTAWNCAAPLRAFRVASIAALPPSPTLLAAAFEPSTPASRPDLRPPPTALAPSPTFPTAPVTPPLIESNMPAIVRCDRKSGDRKSGDEFEKNAAWISPFQIARLVCRGAAF